LDHTEGAQAFP